MTSAPTRELAVAFTAYAVASLWHYAHNAVHLPLYPNMPGWLTQSQIVLAGGALALVGVFGYWLSTTRGRRIGYILIALYAALGFDGLAHYSVASVTAHTPTMNATIWSECLTAALLLAATLRSHLRGIPAGDALERSAIYDEL